MWSELEARPLAPGSGAGHVVRLDEPLSLWGGMDPGTGLVIDRRHPQIGVSVTGCLLVMPCGRGSSSSSTVLAESIRAGTGPVAIVLSEPDPILALGSIVAAGLYDVAVPVVVVPEDGYRSLRNARGGLVEAAEGLGRIVYTT